MAASRDRKEVHMEVRMGHKVHMGHMGHMGHKEVRKDHKDHTWAVKDTVRTGCMDCRQIQALVVTESMDRMEDIAGSKDRTARMDYMEVRKVRKAHKDHKDRMGHKEDRKDHKDHKDHMEDHKDHMDRTSVCTGYTAGTGDTGSSTEMDTVGMEIRTEDMEDKVHKVRSMEAAVMGSILVREGIYRNMALGTVVGGIRVGSRHRIHRMDRTGRMTRGAVRGVGIGYSSCRMDRTGSSKGCSHRPMVGTGSIRRRRSICRRSGRQAP